MHAQPDLAHPGAQREVEQQGLQQAELEPEGLQQPLLDGVQAELQLGPLEPLPGLDDAALWELDPASVQFGADDGLVAHFDTVPGGH